jgi:hypothetical protein
LEEEELAVLATLLPLFRKETMTIITIIIWETRTEAHVRSLPPLLNIQLR